MDRIYDEHVNGRIARTILSEDGVTYGVLDKNGSVLFSTFVAFGHNRSNRAGGYAFRAAAREQERIATGNN